MENVCTKRLQWFVRTIKWLLYHSKHVIENLLYFHTHTRSDQFATIMESVVTHKYTDGNCINKSACIIIDFLV